jgi:type II secretory pathway pseudopilin PulG
MRAVLALILGLMLAVSPALGQGKTKTSAAEEAVAALEVCEAFARNDAGALDAAIEAGWDAYDEESESPYIAQVGASRDIPGLGWGDIFVLVESYPEATFGYCRLDVAQAKGNGKTVIESLSGLDRYAGEVTSQANGTYASLSGSGEATSLLLTHWDDVGFVIQLTIVTPKSEGSLQ